MELIMEVVMEIMEVVMEIMEVVMEIMVLAMAATSPTMVVYTTVTAIRTLMMEHTIAVIPPAWENNFEILI
uniref:Uncharacterized protein n=1 Tax=Acrobeloides nanus TaxID=290746 RepID=A0A914E4Y6_9BILA